MGITKFGREFFSRIGECCVAARFVFFLGKTRWRRERREREKRVNTLVPFDGRGGLNVYTAIELVRPDGLESGSDAFSFFYWTTLF